MDTHTHLCKQLAPLAVRPVPCFDIGDTVPRLTFSSDWSQGPCVHSLCLSSDCQTGSTEGFGFLIKQDAILSHDLEYREHVHRERRATDRKSTWIIVRHITRESKLMKSHTLALLLLHCCVSSNRDFFSENPAVLRLEQRRTGHGCGSKKQWELWVNVLYGSGTDE